MSAKPYLLVNGDRREYEPGVFPDTVQALIASLGLDPSMVVAEVNGDLVRRRDFAARSLAIGDAVELVRFVGGG